MPLWRTEQRAVKAAEMACTEENKLLSRAGSGIVWTGLRVLLDLTRGRELVYKKRKAAVQAASGQRVPADAGHVTVGMQSGSYFQEA